MSDLHKHLESGTTTVCHCWLLTRRDGEAFGFTDHDLDLSFEGQTFRADSGMGAKALSQSTGLSVDNTEAVGALSSDAISEADITAGRFDGASVIAWRVNWADISQREVIFRGEIGDLKRAGGAFAADLRSLASQLNRPLGRIFQKPCRRFWEMPIVASTQPIPDMPPKAYFFPQTMARFGLHPFPASRTHGSRVGH